jgi:hypothetical protein
LHFALALAASLVAGSSAATTTDLPALRAVRSLVAEEALVVSLKHQQRVTATYAQQIKIMIRQQLESELQSFEAPALKAQLAPRVLSAVQAEDQRSLDQIAQQLTQLVIGLERSY